MLTNYSSAYKTWIFSKNEEDGIPVGRVIDFVINPDTGIFEAFWVETPTGLQLLATNDVLRWQEEKIIIHSRNELMSPEAFPKIKHTMEKEIPILGANVFSENNIYIGKVKNFAFDTLSPRILSLKVRSGFWLFGSEKIIPRTRILRITKKGIFVSENVIPLSEKKEKKELLKPKVLDSESG